MTAADASSAPVWLSPQPLVLASQSAARRSLLAAAGIPHEVHPAHIDEPALARAAGATATPAEIAALLADAKAAAVARELPGRLVLAADQTLGCDGRVFWKPADRVAARAQLAALRGRAHALHAAVTLRQDEVVRFAGVYSAHLTMRDFSDRFLDDYLAAAGDGALASVGAYQLEAAGVHLFEAIEGDYFTILGLPMLPVLAALRNAGCLAA